jgi:hypothetical protein
MYVTWHCKSRYNRGTLPCGYCKKDIGTASYMRIHAIEQHAPIMTFHSYCYDFEKVKFLKYIENYCRICNKVLYDGDQYIHDLGDAVTCSMCALRIAEYAEYNYQEVIEGRLIRDAYLMLKQTRKNEYNVMCLNKFRIFKYEKKLFELMVEDEFYDEQGNNDIIALKTAHNAKLLALLKKHIMKDVHDQLLSVVWHPDRISKWKCLL